MLAASLGESMDSLESGSNPSRCSAKKALSSRSSLTAACLVPIAIVAVVLLPRSVAALQAQRRETRLQAKEAARSSQMSIPCLMRCE